MHVCGIAKDPVPPLREQLEPPVAESRDEKMRYAGSKCRTHLAYERSVRISCAVRSQLHSVPFGKRIPNGPQIIVNNEHARVSRYVLADHCPCNLDLVPPLMITPSVCGVTLKPEPVSDSHKALPRPAKPAIDPRISRSADVVVAAVTAVTTERTADVLDPPARRRQPGQVEVTTAGAKRGCGHWKSRFEKLPRKCVSACRCHLEDTRAM